MEFLPAHGRVDCTRCFTGCDAVEFDTTKRTEQDWRITANPLAWGNTAPEVVVLGFSKGPTQAGALASAPHDQIAYKGARANVGKILAHIGLLPTLPGENLVRAASRAIEDPGGRFHFGSLIRCTVERREGGEWKGSGGGMLDKFIATAFGQEIAANCVQAHLATLPPAVKLVVMFGMGSGGNYMREAFKLYAAARKGPWKWINDVAYTDGAIVVVHVEHFATQGAHIENWLGRAGHDRSKYGTMAQDAVKVALGAGIEQWQASSASPVARAVVVAEPPKLRVPRGASAAAGEDAGERERDDIAAILAEVARAGYVEGKCTKKFNEYFSPDGQPLYVSKTSSTLNNAVVYVHPELDPEQLRKMDGVESVSATVIFHANMSRFPKRINKGSTESAYGWKLHLASLSDLARFLKAFDKASRGLH